MKFIQKLSAGLLLSLGSLFLLVAITNPLIYNPQATQKEREQQLSGIIGCYILGAIATASGGFIVWNLHQKHQKQLKQSLDATFYRLLKAESGQITVLQLAMEAQISGDEAKKYLDGKAKEFHASFEPREQGNITYLFDI
ncbi:MAG: hypothetical protein QNJ63_23650 [Calothrix sp. MO_192.B10]|nr:hypothetical protein [Calothrix sp. MO_192.B10]